MAQRKIRVNDKLYRYSIGRTHVKVNGFQAVTLETIGTMEPIRCDCCGEVFDENDKIPVVRPSNIRAFIESQI